MSPTAPIGSAHRRFQLWTYAAWAFVFAINTTMPIFFSAPLTEHHGKLGMSIAVALFLAYGFFLCAFRPELARALIIGGAIVAFMQIFPLFQLSVCVFGMVIGRALGLAEFGEDERAPAMSNELGGFVVTFITGGILLIAAGCLGWWINGSGSNADDSSAAVPLTPGASDGRDDAASAEAQERLDCAGAH
jgi:hypothetical protein